MPGHPIDHAGLETLPFDTCLQLLGSVPLGRVGFCSDGEIVVLPVNHALDGQDIVFRVAEGSKLTVAEQQDLVAFEADHYDARARAGWSVLVTGRAAVVYEEAEVERLGRLGLESWVTTVAHPYWIRIRPTSVTGRRIQESPFPSQAPGPVAGGVSLLGGVCRTGQALVRAGLPWGVRRRPAR
jgi:nitroimidazol reductase NimA-like FMN-containing flavoprotein (pyridoxamine 5'-phosphate oxidase superfamily)